MNYIEASRQIILFPFRVIFYIPKVVILIPVTVIVSFLMLDWEDKWSIEFFNKMIKDLLKF